MGFTEQPVQDGAGAVGLGSPLHSRPVRTSRQLYLTWIRPSMSRIVSSW